MFSRSNPVPLKSPLASSLLASSFCQAAFNLVWFLCLWVSHCVRVHSSIHFVDAHVIFRLSGDMLHTLEECAWSSSLWLLVLGMCYILLCHIISTHFALTDLHILPA
ncbi:hypothetical protein B0H14DRAFT_2865973 [Mycena olivaceomarginata]|nr:hypothetical protein B0H14DRAFT_2865973 [Mycena olivaceomarginata]